VTSLLSQKKEIKRQQALLDKMKIEEEQERQAARQQARERVLLDFEKLQSGVASSASRINGANGASATSVPASRVAGTAIAADNDKSLKRKFALDDDQVAKLQDEQEEKALKEMEREQTERRKAKLPNFWLVSPCLRYRSMFFH
jgi:nitric oxide synthase-interacting protein